MSGGHGGGHGGGGGHGKKSGGGGHGGGDHGGGGGSMTLGGLVLAVGGVVAMVMMNPTKSSSSLEKSLPAAVVGAEAGMVNVSGRPSNGAVTREQIPTTVEQFGFSELTPGEERALVLTLWTAPTKSKWVTIPKGADSVELYDTPGIGGYSVEFGNGEVRSPGAGTRLELSGVGRFRVWDNSSRVTTHTVVVVAKRR